MAHSDPADSHWPSTGPSISSTPARPTAMANHWPLTTRSRSIGTDSAATSSGAHMKIE